MSSDSWGTEDDKIEDKNLKIDETIPNTTVVVNNQALKQEQKWQQGQTIQLKTGQQIEKDEQDASNWDFKEDIKKPINNSGSRKGNRNQAQNSNNQNFERKNRGNDNFRQHDKNENNGRRRGNRNQVQNQGYSNNERKNWGNRNFRQDNRNENYEGRKGNRNQAENGNEQVYRGGRGGYRGRGRGNYQGNYRGNYRGNAGERDNRREEGNQNQENKYTNQNKKQNQILPEPRGRKCWPEIGLYVMKCHLILTYRQIHQHYNDLLIIPYRSLKMDIYPGNVINSCGCNYRKKIQSKGAKLQEPGTLYLQRCIGIDNFKVIGFLKVDDNAQTLQNGIEQVLRTAKKAVDNKIQSILFPMSENLSNPQFVIKAFFKKLENKDYKYKNIFLTTNDSKYFMKSMETFNNQIQNLISHNQICID